MLYRIVSPVIMIVIALIFFMIVAFAVEWTGDLVLNEDVLADNYVLLTAGVLSAGVLIGGACGKRG